MKKKIATKVAKVGVWGIFIFFAVMIFEILCFEVFSWKYLLNFHTLLPLLPLFWLLSIATSY